MEQVFNVFQVFSLEFSQVTAIGLEGVVVGHCVQGGGFVSASMPRTMFYLCFIYNVMYM